MTPRERPADLAVLILLVFTTLWLGLAAASQAGARLVPEALILGVIQGCLGLGIILVPLLVSSHPSADVEQAATGVANTLEVDPGLAGWERQKAWARVSAAGWVVLAAAGAAWAGRSSLRRSWDLPSIPGWSREGLARLQAATRWPRGVSWLESG